MSKVHLRRNKGLNGQAPIAVCASNPYMTATKSGYIPRNSRMTYQFMASEIVDLPTFKATPADNRCLHCMDAGLVLRNKLRAEKGLPPVKSVLD